MLEMKRGKFYKPGMWVLKTHIHFDTCGMLMCNLSEQLQVEIAKLYPSSSQMFAVSLKPDCAGEAAFIGGSSYVDSLTCSQDVQLYRLVSGRDVFAVMAYHIVLGGTT